MLKTILRRAGIILLVMSMVAILIAALMFPMCMLWEENKQYLWLGWLIYPGALLAAASQKSVIQLMEKDSEL